MATKTFNPQIQAAGQGEFYVPSERNPGVVYLADLVSETCSCPDFAFRKQTCKHQRAARLHSYRMAIEAAKALSIEVLKRHSRRIDLRPEVILGIELVLQGAEWEEEAMQAA